MAKGALFFNRNHHQDQNCHRKPYQGLLVQDEIKERGKEEKKERIRDLGRPRFAPEFDRLCCFETIVSHQRHPPPS
ncbi:hypothetical protein AMTR_s00084p00106520 [Amborella trichopoda]|uniref:Uncharacterized protein n=1 Tax=Amborella trichopoda TaxID=13333 RepID=W1P3Z9_AMBTC|nr:hypothetical protein AMTR_s00084p00106520 [Amborella trichopoda]